MKYYVVVPKALGYAPAKTSLKELGFAVLSSTEVESTAPGCEGMGMYSFLCEGSFLRWQSLFKTYHTKPIKSEGKKYKVVPLA